MQIIKLLHFKHFWILFPRPKKLFAQLLPESTKTSTDKICDIYLTFDYLWHLNSNELTLPKTARWNYPSLYDVKNIDILVWEMSILQEIAFYIVLTKLYLQAMYHILIQPRLHLNLLTHNIVITKNIRRLYWTSTRLGMSLGVR